MVPLQLPPNFNIRPIIPKEISCFSNRHCNRYQKHSNNHRHKNKRISARQCWNSFLFSIRITQVFLDGTSRHQQNIIMSGFAQSLKDSAFSRNNNKSFVEGTISTTLSQVAQTFRANKRNDPRLNHDGKTSYILQEHFRGYSNQDRSIQKQKALPIMVPRKMHDIAISHRKKH